jgi:hypothetical protein
VVAAAEAWCAAQLEAGLLEAITTKELRAALKADPVVSGHYHVLRKKELWLKTTKGAANAWITRYMEGE